MIEDAPGRTPAQDMEFDELLARSSVGGSPPDPSDPALLADVNAALEAYADDWRDLLGEVTAEPGS